MLSPFNLLVNLTPTPLISSVSHAFNNSSNSIFPGILHFRPHLFFAVSKLVPQIESPSLRFKFFRRCNHTSSSASSGNTNGNLVPTSLVEDESILYFAHNTLKPRSTYSWPSIEPVVGLPDAVPSHVEEQSPSQVSLQLYEQFCSQAFVHAPSQSS